MKRKINLLNKILLFKSIFVDNVRQKFIVTYKEATEFSPGPYGVAAVLCLQKILQVPLRL